MTLTSFRQSVASQLALALGITFVDGKVAGPIETRDLGCTWIAGVTELSGFVDEETIDLRIRVFKRYKAPVEPELPYDPSPLEALVEAVQASVKANQTGLGPWFQRITSAQIDPDTQGVELSMLAWQLNAGL